MTEDTQQQNPHVQSGKYPPCVYEAFSRNIIQWHMSKSWNVHMTVRGKGSIQPAFIFRRLASLVLTLHTIVFKATEACNFASMLCLARNRQALPAWVLCMRQEITCCAVEVEEPTARKVHKLLALAVVVQGDLLRLHGESKQITLTTVLTNLCVTK